MKAVVREAMEEGAWGLSTGLDYPPGAYADTDELVALSEVAAKMGGFYHTHTRASLKFKRPAGPLAGGSGDRAAQWHSGSPDALSPERPGRGAATWTTWAWSKTPATRAWTLPSTATPTPTQALPSPSACPFWAKDGGPERLMAALKDPSDRDRMKKEMPRERLEDNWLTNFRQPHNKKYDGKSLEEISEMRGQDMADALFDLLLEENLGISTVGLGTNPHTLPAFVSHPAGNDSQRRHPVRRVPEPQNIRLLPHRAGRVRAGRKAPATTGGGTQDDVVPRTTARTAGPGPFAGRVQGRHRGLQPQDGQGPRHQEGPQAVPCRHRLRGRERPGGDRRRREHGCATGPLSQEGTRLNLMTGPLSFDSALRGVGQDRSNTSPLRQGERMTPRPVGVGKGAHSLALYSLLNDIGSVEPGDCD